MKINLENIINIINNYRIKLLSDNTLVSDLSESLTIIEAMLLEPSKNEDLDILPTLLIGSFKTEEINNFISILKDLINLNNLSSKYDDLDGAIRNCKRIIESKKSLITEEIERLKVDLNKVQDIDQLIIQLQTKKPILDIELIEEIVNQYESNISKQNEIFVWLAKYNIEAFTYQTNNKEIEKVKETTTNENTKETATKDNIINLLLEHGIDSFDDFLITTLLNYGNINNYQKILETFKNYDFNLKELSLTSLSDILVKSNGESISNIFEFITEKKLSTDILINYPGLFIPKSIPIFKNAPEIERYKSSLIALQDNFIHSYEILEKLGYDMENVVSKNRTVLFCNSNTVSTNLETLEQYAFNIYPKPDKKFRLPVVIFKSKKLGSAIDSFIEEDLISEIHNAPSLLSNQYIPNRVRLKRTHGETYKNGKKLTREVFSSQKDNIFKIGNKIITNEQLSSHIENDTQTYLEENDLKTYDTAIKKSESNNYQTNKLTDLLDENYKRDDLSYLFSENIIISRNKVIRNINKIREAMPQASADDIGNIILCSIINNSTLTTNQIETIKASITELLKSTGKTKVIS